MSKSSRRVTGAVPAKQAPGRREPLSRQRIVDAALQLVEREGVDALSMRSLGTELGADPMAVYHYFAGKHEILEAVAAAAFARMTLPDPAAPWEVRVRQDALRYRDLAAVHPKLAIHLITQPPKAVAAVLPRLDILYGALAESGLPPRAVARAVDLLLDVVNGQVLAMSAGRTTRGRAEYGPVLAEVPPDHYPALRAVLGALSDADMTFDLEAELDLVIAGIKAIAGERPKGRPQRRGKRTTAR